MSAESLVGRIFVKDVPMIIEKWDRLTMAESTRDTHQRLCENERKTGMNSMMASSLVPSLLPPLTHLPIPPAAMKAAAASALFCYL